MSFLRFTKYKFGVLGAAMAAIGATAQSQTIAITEWMNDTNDEATQGEWVELYNYGTTAVSVGGYKLTDDDTSAAGGATLPAATIQPKDFLIVARDKVAFEANWCNGVANARVIQHPSGFAQSDTGADELVLMNGTTTVWRVAYGANSNTGASTYYTGNDFTITNWGTQAQPINRSGNDPLTGQLGYEGQEYTADPYVYSGAGDVGSPLRGNYTGALNPVAQSTTFNVSLGQNGSYLNPGVRGLANADQALDRHDNSDQTAMVAMMPVVRGSSMRGVSGGLNADIYDWRTRNGGPRPTTLQFLQMARDYDAELYITANVRGLTEPDPNTPGFRRYYTTDTATLAGVAADWVRYCNRIVQTYHQGDTITDTRDAAILNSLTWSTSYINEFGTSDLHTTLPAVGEAPLKKVKYWEIGNEPLVSLANAYSTTNAYTFSGTAGNSTFSDYVNRYIAISTAMIAEDPTIKVGPCIVNARAGDNHDILDALLASGARVDFIAYHPYGSMGDYQIPPSTASTVKPAGASFQQGYLSGVYREQFNFLADIKAVVASRRVSQVNTMEYAATENDVSDFRTNNSYQEGTMAHALGTVESIFSWGRMGLSAAHYWIWIFANSTVRDDEANKFAVTMAYEKLRDRLGDRLLGSFDSNDKVHAYAVGSSTSTTLTVWAMNFSNDTTMPLTLQVSNANGISNTRVYMERLQAISGVTTLASANLGLQMPFGPQRQVDWTSRVQLVGADPSNLTVSLPAATLTLLTIENAKITAAQGWQMYQ
jgi:hypothetical protein